MKYYHKTSLYLQCYSKTFFKNMYIKLYFKNMEKKDWSLFNYFKILLLFAFV